jgi:RimJ/RimL family protein N-acetyltransferase
MPDPSDDIVTPRLVLRLMRGDAVEAALAGDLRRVEALLGVTVPADLLAHPSSLTFAKARLDEDPAYQPWSARALILPGEQRMIGHIRFHTRPDPDYLHGYARNAVEFGYAVFSEYRRRGYALEAAGAVMDWARAMFGIRRFVASISPDNAASLALVAGLGFVRVGQQVDEVDGVEDVFLREVKV